MNRDPATLLTHLVSIPSLSRDERVLASYLVDVMDAWGFDARLDDAGNALGVRRGAAVPAGPPDAPPPGREIVLLGHMDTVPGDIPVRVDGDVLHGRGSVDAKGPLACFVAAVAAVEPAPDVTLTVIGAVEEETTTSRGARAVVDRHRPEACFIGEPSGWDAITVGYKGRLVVRYALEQPCGHGAGPRRAAPEVLCDFWREVQGLCDAANAGRERLFDQVLPSLAEVSTTSDGLHDVVEATVGFRLPPAFDSGAFRDELARRAAPAALRFVGEEPAHASSRTSPPARGLRRAILARGGRGAFKHKTGTADMNVLAPVWGCPMVAYGPGDSTLDHTPEERVSLTEVRTAAEILADALIGAGWAQAAPGDTGRASAPPRVRGQDAEQSAEAG